VPRLGGETIEGDGLVEAGERLLDTAQFVQRVAPAVPDPPLAGRAGQRTIEEEQRFRVAIEGSQADAAVSSSTESPPPPRAHRSRSAVSPIEASRSARNAANAG
jgi:hypothetical protein